MLQKRTLLAVGFLAVVAAAVVWKTTRPDPHVKRAAKPGETLPPPVGVPTIKAAEIDELEVTEPGKATVVLKRVGAEWRLAQPVDDRADQKNVESALQALEKAIFKEVVAETAGSYEKLQVKDDQVVKVVPKKGGQPVTTLYIGKTGNVRIGDAPQVWTVTGLNRMTLTREVKMWRDREILRVEKDAVDRVEVVLAGGAKIAAHRTPPPAPASQPDADPHAPKPPAGPDKWNLTEGAALVGGPLDETVPAGILTALMRLDAVEFADGVTPEAAGLDAPRATINVVLTDGGVKTLLIGKEDGTDVLVKRPDSPRVWKVRKASVDAWIRPAMQWRDKQLSKLEAKDVVRIEITKGAEKAVFERVDEKSWKAVVPAEFAELDSLKVQGVASAFVNLRAASVVEDPAAAKGFAKPTGTIVVKKADGSTVTLTVGPLVEKSYHVKVSGRAEVFAMPEATVNRVLKGPADFKKAATPPGGPGGMPGMPGGHGGMPPGH